MRLSRALALAAALVVVTSCGSDQVTISPPASTPSGSSGEASPVDEVLAAFATLDPSTAFERASWRFIADHAPHVVMAEVLESGPGRTIGLEPDDPFADHVGAAQVRVTSVAKSRRPRGLAVGDEIWVELLVDADALAGGLKPGMRVALFLTLESALRSEGYHVTFPDSILPQQATVWAPSHPRGILVEPVPGDGFVVPYDALVHPSQTMAEFLELLTPTPPRRRSLDPRGVQLPPYFGEACRRVGLAALSC